MHPALFIAIVLPVALAKMLVVNHFIPTGQFVDVGFGVLLRESRKK